MKRITTLILAIVLSFIAAQAQESYRVGEKVELECNCFGPTEWVPATIEQIQSGGTYRVRFGSGTYNYLEAVGTSRIRRPGAGAAMAKQGEMRRQFMQEAAPYRESVYALMMVFDENLKVGNEQFGPPVRAEDWTKTMNNLAALDNICTTKYAGMKNDPKSPWKDDLAQLPATWCEIASKRNELEKSGRGLALAQQLGPMKNSYLRTLGEKMDEAEPYLSYDYQSLLFEPSVWRSNFLKTATNAQSGTGASVPDSYFTEIFSKAVELKTRIERDAPGRSFKMPPYRDAAIEQQVRGAYSSQLKGTQILKIGLDYTTWKIWKNSLGIPTSQTKRGRTLVKIPNRPFCQEQEFVIVREYAGGGAYRAAKVQNGVGGAGLIMSCD